MESENMMNQDAQEESKAQEMENTPKVAPQENTMRQEAPGEVMKKPDAEKTKMSKKQVIGLVVLSLIALGGVLFGIYGMNSQNDQIANLKVQVSDANDKVTQLETGKVTITDSDGTVTEITDSTTIRRNPIISAAAPKYYNLGINSPRYTVNGTEYYVALNIKNGDISSCALYTHTTKFIDYDMVETNRFDRDCSGINGISGKIYKAVTIGEGQDGSANSVAFIMEDGTVEYILGENLVTNIVNSDAADIKGALSIDGFVIDAFTVGVGEDGAKAGGYATTIFVLSDGSYVKYEDSMLN